MAEAILKGGATDVVALVSTAEGKASIVVGIGEAARGKVDAVPLVRAASAAAGGKGGGGRPEMAQAGGPDAALADAALDAVRHPGRLVPARSSWPAECRPGPSLRSRSPRR